MQARTGPPTYREYPADHPLTVWIGPPKSVPRKNLANITNDKQKKKKLKFFQKLVGPYLSFLGKRKITQYVPVLVLVEKNYLPKTVYGNLK